jgi:UDP-N-acetylmuramyl pentapeptide phosphotransferase/UDP-N-acetylglucosamine-1-phosphate transferase
VIVAGWFFAGAAACWAVWVVARGAFAVPVFARENVRGRTVPTAAGVVITVAALALEGAVTVAQAAGADVSPAALTGRRVVLVLVLGMSMLGLLDDLGGVGESGGFRGHLRALARGRLTTGAVKLFGGAAVAIVAVSLIEPDDVGRLIADAALVALAANLANLLDRAPGRVTKVALVAFLGLAVAVRAPTSLAGVAVAVGAAAALLVPDLREELMLGDAGANAIGAALGIGVVLTCSTGARNAVLIVLVVLNLASEVVSFSRVIDRIAPLRALDRMGRRP